MCLSGEENLERVGEGKPVPFAHDANVSDWNLGEPFLYVGTHV